MPRKTSSPLGYLLAAAMLTSCTSGTNSTSEISMKDPASVSMPPPSPTPELYRPLVNKAVDANEAGQYDEARRRYNEIIAKDPTGAEADYCRGELALMDDKYQQAVNCFTAALAKNPRLETAYNDRGNAYRHLGDENKAISDYSVAMLLGPGPVHWVCRARSYLAKKDYYKAMQDATTAINKDRNYSPAYAARAEAWVGLNNSEQAQIDYDRALQITGESPDMLSCRGQFYLNHDETAKARLDFARAVSKAPDDGDNYYWLGRAELELQNIDKAAAAFNKYKQLSQAAHLADEVETADDWLEEVQTQHYDLANKPAATKHQWALACSAQLFAQNNEGLWSLAGEEPTKENIAREKQLLLDWWDISCRDDLLSTLDYQWHTGHNSSWKAYRRMLKWQDPMDHIKKLLNEADDPIQMNTRLNLVRAYGDQCGDRGLMAWDLCRYISLCRWGYRVGWLSESEAYERIMPAAVKLQTNYSSWQQLGEEYLIGRHFWNSSQYLEDKEKSERALHHLLSWPASPWVALPWHTNLN